MSHDPLRLPRRLKHNALAYFHRCAEGHSHAYSSAPTRHTMSVNQHPTNSAAVDCHISRLANALQAVYVVGSEGRRSCNCTDRRIGERRTPTKTQHSMLLHRRALRRKLRTQRKKEQAAYSRSPRWVTPSIRYDPRSGKRRQCPAFARAGAAEALMHRLRVGSESAFGSVCGNQSLPAPQRARDRLPKR
jgi:hypothetical protein